MKLIKRSDEEKQFEDEVEYEANENVREKFKDFKYMKSFAKNEWNQYDSLPTFYKKLFVFQNVGRLGNVVKKIHKEERVAL